MRAAAAEHYRAEAGGVWRPRRGSHTSQTGHLTSATIDVRDFLRARNDRAMRAQLPEGTLVAIAGGKDVRDPGAVTAKLDQARAKHPDIVLVHGSGPGVERIAAQWAERNGVHQVVCRPDWNRHGYAAPFRRNDELLNLLPRGVIAFPGSGITDNLVDKAVKLDIPVARVTRAATTGRADPPRRAAHRHEPANAARNDRRPMSGLEAASTPRCSRPTPARPGGAASRSAGERRTPLPSYAPSSDWRIAATRELTTLGKGATADQ